MDIVNADAEAHASSEETWQRTVAAAQPLRRRQVGGPLAQPETENDVIAVPMTFHVLPTDVAEGEPGSPTNDPVIRAIRRLTGQSGWFGGAHYAVSYSYATPTEKRVIRYPVSVQRAIEAYDKGEAPMPPLVFVRPIETVAMGSGAPERLREGDD